MKAHTLRPARFTPLKSTTARLGIMLATAAAALVLPAEGAQSVAEPAQAELAHPEIRQQRAREAHERFNERRQAALQKAALQGWRTEFDLPNGGSAVPAAFW